MQQVHENNKSPLMENKQDHHHNNQAAAAAAAEALRCPRCDSANTKFCYYNNYSLSQPRHFCKACKRYWTRGGTLRNVPVGGGCRKSHKRLLKRPSTTNPNSSSTSAAAAGENPNQFQIINQMNNPLFYGKQQQSNPPPPSYDQLASFASNGFSYPTAGAGAASSFFAGGGASTDNNNNSAATDAILSPTMATLLASTLNSKFSSSSVDRHQHFQAAAAFGGLEMSSGVKSEQQGWSFNGFANGNNNNNNNININSSGGQQAAAVEQIGSDPQSAYYWNAMWHDPGNIGPSVTSLI